VQVGKANLDGFERRASFEEGYEILNRGVFFLVTKLNRVREKPISRRFVQSQCNERLVSFSIRPPKIFGSLA